MSKFATVSIGPMSIDDNTVTIASGKQLKLGQDGTDPFSPVTKRQLDALQLVINTIAGSDTNFDTLLELKNFIDLQTANGVTNLTNAVAAEASARDAAVAAEAAVRAAADLAEASARDAAVSAEAATRVAAVSAEAAIRAAVDSDLAAADLALSNKLFRHVKVPLSSSIIPDEAQPMPTPFSITNTTTRDGWYFKNGGPSSSTRKINWYIPVPVSPINFKATFASLLEINILVKLISITSSPFINVYTKLKSSGNAASWYNAKYTYEITSTSGLEANGNYLLRAPISGSTLVGSYSGFTSVNLTKTSTSVGTILPDDEILFVSIATNSAATAGNVNCLIHELDFYSTHGNFAHQFSNADVMNKFLLGKIDNVYATMGQNPLPSQELA